MLFTDKDVFDLNGKMKFQEYVANNLTSENAIELNFTKDYLKDNINLVYKLLNNYVTQKMSVHLIIDADYLEFEIVDKLQKLKSNGDIKIDIKGIEYDEQHDIDSIVKVQRQAKNFIKNVRELKLSPLEKFLLIYNFVGTRIYKKEKDGEAVAKSRAVYSVLEGDDIVCAGYANLMIYLCNQSGIENLKVVSHFIDTFDPKTKQKHSGHENNFVYIDDEKYGIKGWYFIDACWDSRKSINNPPTIKYCLLTFAQAKKVLGEGFRSRTLLFEDQSRRYSQLKDIEIERRFGGQKITYQNYQRRFDAEIDLVISSGKYDNFIEQCKKNGESDEVIKALLEEKIKKDYGIERPDNKTLFKLTQKDKEIRFNSFMNNIESTKEIDKQTFIDALNNAYGALTEDEEALKYFTDLVVNDSFKPDFVWRNADVGDKNENNDTNKNGGKESATHGDGESEKPIEKE